MVYNTIEDVISGLLYADGFLAGIRDKLMGQYPTQSDQINQMMLNLTEIREAFENNPDPESMTLDDLKQRKKAEIASARYEYEISGITFHDVHITTDREDQAMITATALSAVLDQTYTTVWKGADGYLTLNASEILEMARAVADHVESAFAEEKRLVELIDSATTEEELSSITWTL